MTIDVVDMLDFIGQDPDINILASLKPPKVAGYESGSNGILWPTTDWSAFPDSGHVIIDQEPGLALLKAGKGDVGDVETRAATIADLAAAAEIRWADFRLETTCYISAGNVNAAHAYFTSRGIIQHIFWWVADWSLNRAEAIARISDTIVAVQWASPSSNPSTLVPGDSKLTLKAANVDLSVARADWHPAPQAAPAPPPAPAPPQKGVLITAALKALSVSSEDGITWTWLAS